MTRLRPPLSSRGQHQPNLPRLSTHPRPSLRSNQPSPASRMTRSPRQTATPVMMWSGLPPASPARLLAALRSLARSRMIVTRTGNRWCLPTRNLEQRSHVLAGEFYEAFGLTWSGAEGESCRQLCKPLLPDRHEHVFSKRFLRREDMIMSSFVTHFLRVTLVNPSSSTSGCGLSFGAAGASPISTSPFSSSSSSSSSSQSVS